MIGKARHVEDHRAEVIVRTASPELQRLHQVIAVVPLEVLHVHAAGSLVEVLVLDPPLVKQLRVFRVFDADDVGALGPIVAVDHARDVHERTVQLLLHVHVGD